MLRALVGLALLANLLWFAATQGWLPAAWLPLPDDTAQREPKRLDLQVRPEAVTLRGEPAGPADRGAPACLQSGAIAAEATLAAAEAALAAAGLAAGRWTRLETADGAVLRIDGADAPEREAVRRAAQEAGGAAFSRCP